MGLCSSTATSGASGDPYRELCTLLASKVEKLEYGDGGAKEEESLIIPQLESFLQPSTRKNARFQYEHARAVVASAYNSEFNVSIQTALEKIWKAGKPAPCFIVPVQLKPSTAMLKLTPPAAIIVHRPLSS